MKIAPTPRTVETITAGLNTALLVAYVVGFGWVSAASVADIKRADPFFTALRTLTFVVTAISVVALLWLARAARPFSRRVEEEWAGSSHTIRRIAAGLNAAFLVALVVGWVIRDVDATKLVDLFSYALIALMFIVPAITVSVVALLWSEQD